MFDRGIPRDECKILDGNEIGIITSGTFSPLLKNGIALGYIDQNYNNNQNIFIDIRGVEKKATIVNPPFYDQKEFGHKREKWKIMKINDYEILEDRLYTKEHEWIKLDGEYAIIGITDYAAKLLNDIVYVEMPEIEKELKAGESFGSVESVKTASEVYLPVSGRVVEINNELNESPEIINNSPYEKGWIIKIKPSNYEKEKLELLDMNKYGKIISNNK